MADDPISMMRAFNKMRTAGFMLSVEGENLVVEPASKLTDEQRGFLRTHKAALVGLLSDAETLADALAKVGTAGLGWREGTPPDWSDVRLLSAGEVLYATKRMINVLGRRYSVASAPPMPDFITAPKVQETALQEVEAA